MSSNGSPTTPNKLLLKKNRNCLPFVSIWVNSRFFAGVRIACLFIFLYCVVFFVFVCLCPVSCVLNVASISGLTSSCVLCPQCCQCLWIVFVLYLVSPMLPVSLDCLRPVSCVLNVASVSGLSSSCVLCPQCCQCL